MQFKREIWMKVNYANIILTTHKIMRIYAKRKSKCKWQHIQCLMIFKQMSYLRTNPNKLDACEKQAPYKYAIKIHYGSNGNSI